MILIFRKGQNQAIEKRSIIYTSCDNFLATIRKLEIAKYIAPPEENEYLRLTESQGVCLGLATYSREGNNGFESNAQRSHHVKKFQSTPF